MFGARAGVYYIEEGGRRSDDQYTSDSGSTARHAAPDARDARHSERAAASGRVRGTGRLRRRQHVPKHAAVARAETTRRREEEQRRTLRQPAACVRYQRRQSTITQRKHLRRQGRVTIQLWILCDLLI